MRPASVHILLLLLVLPCLLTGCAQRGRVIPEEKMSRIYEDMLLADQWLRDHPDSRKAADTTLFFDPIFKRYGYSFEDFDRSVNYYVDHPEQYTKILKKCIIPIIILLVWAGFILAKSKMFAWSVFG